MDETFNQLLLVEPIHDGALVVTFNSVQWVEIALMVLATNFNVWVF